MHKGLIKTVVLSRQAVERPYVMFHLQTFLVKRLQCFVFLLYV